MTSYADYCPITAGVEVLGDRWTPLVIRELMVGSEGFNEIHRGIPRMSRTLLAQRLRMLERRGLIRREGAERGRPGRYVLTDVGQALTPIVWSIGQWAAEWIFGDPTDDDCDGLSVIWRMHQHAINAKLPEQRVVVHLVLTGPGAAQGWLGIDQRGITACKDDPGYDIDLVVEADTGHMQRWLIGVVSFRELLRNGHARVIGPSRLARTFPTWFDTSFFSTGLDRARLHRDEHAVSA
jgi:DNA-binding HxlR family transcriptional regulator